jgi:transcription elongation factor Elf1
MAEGKGEEKAVCPSCGSVNWEIQNIINTTTYKGLIQAECGDCGQLFEFEAKNVSGGWTHFSLDELANSLEDDDEDD